MRIPLARLPRRRPSTSRATLRVAGTVGALVAGLCAAGFAAPTTASAAEWATPNASGGFALHGNGNGHGHGMSQYGAQGAAIAGLSTDRILAFYYPGTHLTRLAASTIRVRVSAATSDTTVFAGTPGLSVTAFGKLPASGYSRYRLAPHGGGLALAGRKGSSWKTLAKNLPARADFASSAGWVQLALSDGSSTRYRGTVGAVRSGSGEDTINRVSLDGYTEGVAPREMPASWRTAAVGAQAVAARTYGRNAAESGYGASYDICDTTSCQVYGGMAHYSSGGSLQWTDDPAAIAGNENTVLTYRGRTIFAQFSASNGGAMLDGGQPYLVGKADPYDAAASGDPYLGWTANPSSARVAGYYGLKTVRSIEITRRNGYGRWGGWVLAATVYGTDYSGASTHVTTTGGSLASAMGLMTALFHFDYQQPLPTAPRAVAATVNNASAVVTWQPPANAAGATITKYVLRWGRHRSLAVGSGQRSAVVSPLYLRTSQRIWVEAANARGSGPQTVLRVRGTPSPHGVAALSRARLFDTRASRTVVDAAHPLLYDLATDRALPTVGLRSVQLSVSVFHPSASGRLSVYTEGAPSQPDAVINYTKGQGTTATVSLQMQPSTRVRFVPSAGSVGLLADRQGYSAWHTSGIRAVAPTLLKTVWRVAPDAADPSSPVVASSTVPLAGAPGVTPATRAVLVSVQGWTHRAGGLLRIWPDGEPHPWVADVSVGTGSGTNTVLVALPRSGRLRLSSTVADAGARVTLLGVAGAGAGQLLETYPTDPVADLTVGRRITRQPIAGVSQVPLANTTAVWLQLRVSSPGRAGRLFVWPSGGARPASPVLRFGASGTQTATTLVKVGAGHAMELASTVDGAKVSITSFGYLTSG